MEKVTFTCETVTPLFLAGADGTTPELRAPSIKGALRFWWRAMNWNLVQKKGDNWDYTKLKEQEGKIFGDTGKRSAILLRILNESVKGNKQISLTPHHRQGYCDDKDNSKNCHFKKGNTQCSKSFTRKGEFTNFDLVICFDEQIINQEELEQLVKVAFLLGGLGKRSRRGFGSVRITQIEKKAIFSSLQEVEEFVNSIPKKSDIESDYPFIMNIEIGKPYLRYEDLLIKIGESSHINKHDSLGYAHNNGRFASPIYTSILKIEKEFYPIITTLNTVFELGKKPIPKATTLQQTNYKSAIL